MSLALIGASFLRNRQRKKFLFEYDTLLYSKGKDFSRIGYLYYRKGCFYR